jgi:orotidine-5'-phosphate decarboxylase
VIEATASTCVAVKLQLACFERLGADGWTALENAVVAAREHGLLVLADGKRGDVPVTAQAYAQALVGETPTPFGTVAGLGADAFTANPLLGRDSLAPLIESGAGCFLLVRTSNPGAADVQDLVTKDGPVYEVLARMVAELGADRIGDCGLSSVGAVTGATRPDLLELAAAFEPHPAAALVSASRSIVDAPDPAAAAEEMRRAAWALAC